MPKKNKKKNKKRKDKEEKKESAVDERSQRSLKEAFYSRPSKKQETHDFWDNQPVPKLDEDVQQIGPIETKNVEDVRKTPYALPNGFEWFALDLKNKIDVDGLYNLLSDHYVEDDDNMFRFNYSREFLQWALMPPNFLKKWHLAVRVTNNKKLVACITAIPAEISVQHNNIKMVEINFLCVHKKLRTKRLAPVLIKEITRRVNEENIWQAAYTAGVVIPKPVAKNQYWHRSFDPKKLVDIGFSSIPRNSTLGRMIRLAKLGKPPNFLQQTRKMEKKDCKPVCKLLADYLKQFKYHPVLKEEDIEHWFLPREDVIQTYVVEKENKITDFFSFYCLKSHVMKNEKHKDLNAVYSYYNVPNTESWLDLMNAALHKAKEEKKDVFNCLNVMENKEESLEKLKFGPGDGYLQYYLYNYKTPELKPNEVGLVLM